MKTKNRKQVQKDKSSRQEIRVYSLEELNEAIEEIDRSCTDDTELANNFLYRGLPDAAYAVKSSAQVRFEREWNPLSLEGYDMPASYREIDSSAKNPSKENYLIIIKLTRLVCSRI